MSNLYEDHAAAFAQLVASTGLTVYRDTVPDGAAEQYVKLYTLFETPDGTVAPDAIRLSFDQGPLDVRMYCHCVGVTEQSALATAARVRTAVLNQVLTVPGRTCFPIRWREGQPVRPDEEIPGSPVQDMVEVYGWRSLPA